MGRPLVGSRGRPDYRSRTTSGYSRPGLRAHPSPARHGPRWLALALVVGLAGCASHGVSGVASERGSSPAFESGSAGGAGGASASESRPQSPTPTPEPRSVAPAPTPHQGAIAVVEFAVAPSSMFGQRVLAIRLEGDVGTSAVLRTLEIQARMEPIDGSSCETPPLPAVMRASHPEAMQPALTDITRTVIVRSLGSVEGSEGLASSASFRVGPVPSLNGAFEGWVSFHVPAASADGFCAFDVLGLVVVVAGETTTAELPVIRVDTRTPFDGR
jgi:hypothetical protein